MAAKKAAKGPCPVLHFEINGKDNKKAKAFYSKMFNWKIDLMPAMGYGMVDADGDKKGQINGGLMADGKPYVTVYVQVPNVTASLEQAKKLGGKIVQKQIDMADMGFSIGMFKSPDGNLIGLMADL